MKLPISSFSAALSVAAAVVFVACGGGSDDSPDAAARAEADLPDARTVAQAERLVAAAEAAAAELPRPADAGSEAPADASSGGRRWFPGVKQTNLVANREGFGAAQLEPELRNAWGIAIRPAGLGGHFWVTAAVTGKSIQYVGDVGGTPLHQDELAVVDTRGAATGVAFNPGPDFVVTQPFGSGTITNAAKFLFANASGTISAWTERPREGGVADQPIDSVTVVDGTARQAAFLGVTVAPDAEHLLAADFGAEPALRRYDGRFAEQAPLPNPFRPAAEDARPSFEAFNVQSLGRQVFATYGRHVPPGPDGARPAEGRLAEFDAQGRYVARWWGRGMLNYPWGVARAPADFGLYAGCLLVGNFGDGTLVAFHPRLKVALDYVRDERGERVVVDGLWGLQFGNGASLGEADHMYFAAGPNHEQDGLFGKFQTAPWASRLLGGLSMCR